MTDARIQAAKVIAGILKSFQGARRGRNGSAEKSPNQREGVFDAHGRVGDGARAWAVLQYARPMTGREDGMVPARSRGTMPTNGF